MWEGTCHLWIGRAQTIASKPDDFTVMFTPSLKSIDNSVNDTRQQETHWNHIYGNVYRFLSSDDTS